MDMGYSRYVADRILCCQEIVNKSSLWKKPEICPVAVQIVMCSLCVTLS